MLSTPWSTQGAEVQVQEDSREPQWPFPGVHVPSKISCIRQYQHNHCGAHSQKINKEFRKEFETLMAEFPIFFRTNEEIWRDTLREVTDFMEKEKDRRRPREKNDLGYGLMIS